MSNPTHRQTWKWILFAVMCYVGYAGWQIGLNYVRTGRDVETIREIVSSEELILHLTEQLSRLSSGISNLTLPGHYATELFSDHVAVMDLAPATRWSRTASLADMAVTQQTLPVDDSTRQVPREQLNLWNGLLERVAFFENAKFYIVDGHFLDAERTQFQTNMGFRGLARTVDESWSGMAIKLTVHWQRDSGDAGDSPAAWRITDWISHPIHSAESSELLFEETLDRVLTDGDDLKRARESEHQRAVVRYYEGGATRLPEPYFSPVSANLKPGLSVVDVDGDGFDDLYVTVRMGPNRLYRSRGDGTFEEVASRWGLDIRGHSTCAIFADFDNDGDADLMLGRSIQRSMYLENLGRRFVARDLQFAGRPVLPYLAASMSAADYNRDGLLDVYISTYRPAVLENVVAGEQRSQREERHREGSSPSAVPDDVSQLDGIAEAARAWPDEFLTKEQAAEYFRRYARDKDRATNVLDQIGPPNLLLQNLGEGRFGIATENSTLGMWRNSFQATWADYDQDGDPDLYVANDWADDHLFRNDGAAGFVDVTTVAGTTAFGFAMGATWGDYDNDGSQDLYVSNMYSKAGRRITSKIAGLSPAYARSVAGNYLYHQESSGTFRLVSGLEPPAIPVANAGWSWGGQFCDLNNDSFLDLYVLSGYFTPPKQFSTTTDL